MISALFRLRRFGADRRGIAALEFAMIVPLMITLFFGSIELAELMGANKRVETVASSIADVVARDIEVTGPELSDIWTAASVLMYPNSTSPLKIRMSSLQFTTPGEAKVLESRGSGISGYADNHTIVDAKLDGICGGPSVIFVETFYDYTPPIGVFLKIDYDLKHESYACPRVVDTVTISAPG